jgi:hypothetical protein
MSLQHEAVKKFEQNIDGTATLIPEHNNTEELFYVGITNTSTHPNDLTKEMTNTLNNLDVYGMNPPKWLNKILNKLDDVTQTVQIAPEEDIAKMNINETDYDTILRVGQTLN